jgi:tetratricopeptide (TPR) repeat protein
LASLDCGGVSAMIGHPDDPDFFAAQPGGRVLRAHLGAPDTPPRIVAEQHLPGADVSIARLGFRDAGKAIQVFDRSGARWDLKRDLTGAPKQQDFAFDCVESPLGWRARLTAGPEVRIEAASGQQAERRIGLGRSATGLAVVGAGRFLAVACDGEVLLIDASPAATTQPSQIPGFRLAAGSTLVVGDSEDANGRFLVSDSAGQIQIVEPAAPSASLRPRAFDEIPELAFRPEQRVYRPRSKPTGGAARSANLENAAAALDRSVAGEVRNDLREIVRDGGLEPSELAEALVLLAACEQHLDGFGSAVDDALLEAARLFERAGHGDREADLRLWRGALLLPPIDSTGSAGDSAGIEAGLVELERAVGLYSKGHPPDLRQAAIAETYVAWGLLNLGEPSQAMSLMRTVQTRRDSDLVLQQAGEIDRVLGAIHSSRGEWKAAAEAEDRALASPAAAERPGLRRVSSRAKRNALAAQGLWRELAALAPQAPDAPDDDWALHRLTAQARGPGGPKESESAQAIPAVRHFKARREAEAGSLKDAVVLLERAIAAYAEQRLDDLALEAGLECAEVLEKLGRWPDALKHYERVTQRLRPVAAGPAGAPISSGLGRAYRGSARCLLALNEPGRALATVAQADLADWFSTDGQAVARSAGLGLPPESAAVEDKLRHARRDHGAHSAAARALERELENDNRVLALGDSDAAFDVSSLQLAQGEAVLVYAALGPHSLHGFLLRGENELFARRLPVSRDELRKGIWSWRKSLGDRRRGLAERDERPGLEGLLSLSPEPDTSPTSGTRPAGPTWGAYLDDSLIRPFEGDLTGVTQLFVIPCDDIGALPLEAIGRSKRVVDRFAVSYVPHLATLRALRAEGRLKRTHQSRAVAIAEPADRLRYLGSALAAEEQLLATYVGKNASFERLCAADLADSRLVYLSVRAQLRDPQSPSGHVALMLPISAKDEAADGITGRDLMRLGIRAQVLVLDSTDRAERENVSGAGLVALVRAAMTAGAEWVVLGLWDAPEESRGIWASEFHRRLSEGLSPPDALRQARRVVEREPRFCDPVHWAGYVLYGAP